MPSALPTDYQSYIHLSRYARWDSENKRRETWEETVDRYVNFFKARSSANPKMADFDWSEVRLAILNLEVMPSMRCLMTSGKALDIDNVAGFNCAYTAIDSVRSFDEVLYILMCGTGVGFSVEQEFTKKLPEVPSSIDARQDIVLVVDDSKIGWADAFRQLLGHLWEGREPTWDVSGVRPAGAPLKTFGGRASGPDPLVDLFKFSVSLLRGAAGRHLTPLECHDLVCKVADIVVVGGVRRSALISLSDLSDSEMSHAKSGNWWEKNGQRALANNSVAYKTKPTTGQFMREWTSLYESFSGERGMFNREAAKIQAAKNGRRDPGYDFGSNPCCVTGDTPILTRGGHLPIRDLVGRHVDVWNGTAWSLVTPVDTGVHPIYRVTLSDGTWLDCTSNHKFATWEGFSAAGSRAMVEASSLVIGTKLEKFPMPVIEGTATVVLPDAYSQGFYSGDRNSDLRHSWLYEPKFMCQWRLVGTVGADYQMPTGGLRRTWRHGEMLPKGFVPTNETLDYRLRWLAGILDSDGTVTRDQCGNGLQITACDVVFLRAIRLMLTGMGVRAKVVSGSPEGYRQMPDGRGGLKAYSCRAGYRLLIGNADTYDLTVLGLKTERLKIHGTARRCSSRAARRFVKVTSVEPLGFSADTYCFNEPTKHLGTFNGIVTGQSEIILRSKQFCNLSEVVVRSGDTVESLTRKVRIASILGTLQSTLTDFRYLSEDWTKNTREECLLGVSLTGIMDNRLTSSVHAGLPGLLGSLRQVTIDTNKEFAARLGVNQSTATTCVKPSGTVSQLVLSGSGMHSWYSDFYVRTIRADKKDPMSQLMVDAGFYVEDDVTKPHSTNVFYFPTKAPAGAVTRNERTAIEQLELWLAYQLHWCEHKPSVTIYVREDEWLEVGAWVWKNFDLVSGVSFLPHNDSDTVYKQAPYQEISEAQYNEWMAKAPGAVDWSLIGLYEGGNDQTTGMREFACVAGVCEIL